MELKLTRSFTPWLVLAAVLCVFGMVAWDYAHRPMTVLDIFTVLLMAGSGAYLVINYFRMYAIFDKWDAEARDRNS